MDELTNSILELSSQGEYAQLLTRLKQSGDVFNNQQINLLDAAERLDAQQHSLGILYMLHAHTKRPNLPQAQRFIDTTSTYLRQCAAHQIQLAPQEFCDLCRRYKEALIHADVPRLGLGPMLAAVEKLQPTPETLTPLHADICQLALLSKVYNAAAPFLEGAGLLALDPPRTSFAPADFLLYCYYGGMVCIGRRRYRRALELLLGCLTAPTGVSSAITLAAYKKYVLVALLHSGSLPPLPRFTPSKVRALVEGEAKPYAELAQVHAASATSPENLHKLRTKADQHAALFQADGNLGLVKLVLGRSPSRTIAALTSTYVTLPLADIAAQAGLGGAGEAEGAILRMVAGGEVAAVISQREGLVTFTQDPHTWDDPASARRLEEALADSMALAERLQALSEALAVDRNYLSKVGRDRSGGGGGYGGGGGSQGAGPSSLGALGAAAAMMGGGGDEGPAGMVFG